MDAAATLDDLSRDKRSAQASGDVSADLSYDNIEMETMLSATVRCF